MRGITVGVAVVAVVAAGLSGSSSDVAAQSCAQPYQPWFVYGLSIQPYPATYPDTGDPIVHTERPLDMDGDGKADILPIDDSVAGHGHVVVERADGTLEITSADGINVAAGATQSDLAYGSVLGDLDGDSRDELLVMTGDISHPDSFIIPGATPPGSHAVADVGIAVGPVGFEDRSVGDQDGDGGSDWAIRTGETSWKVLAGADLMAPGPGGTLGSPAPIATFDASQLVAVAFDVDARPAIVTGRTVDGDYVVEVRTDPSVELVERDYGSGADRLALGASRNDAGEEFVQLQQQDRGGTSFIWNLTDPCSRFGGAAAETPRAPAPDPVSGGASYTG